MMTPEEATEHHHKIAEEARRREEEYLRRAKEEAAERGKEPFDLDRLAEIYNIGGYSGKVHDMDTVRKYHEHKYYVSYPEFMTIKEYATFREEKLDPYS